ncbi:MAG: ribosome biogenesis GTPase Der [Candidatus Caenarcaniphilales bacterium]|nr:ribosome biogenesis GTPase Der [Candidatus Caenarcaniphilales bacterium]
MKNVQTKPNKLFTIAIVGAPNVGKSTFFNKLIGGRRSIVEDQPGITRDKIYADVNLARWSDEDKDFFVRIIDTGGLFFREESLFQGVQRQAESSIEEADCIIFVTDARAGVTTTDTLVAKMLRERTKKNPKPVILLTNKIDSTELETLSAEFYNLGFGEPLAFSSLGTTFKRSVNDLLARIQEVVKQDKDEYESSIEKNPQLRVVILGKPNVGKSSLLNSLVGYERALVHDEAGTTRDALDTELIYKDKEFLLIDTAGLRRKSKVYGELERFSVDRTIKGLVRADVAVLVMDATALSTIEGVSNQEKKLASLIQSRFKACVIVLNKWDLIEKTENIFDEYNKLIKYHLKFVDYAPVVITSASTGQRVENILEQCLKVNESYNRRISTGLLNNVFRELTTIHEPAKAGAKDLKIYYLTQVETKPPTFALFVNEPKKVKESYLRFLERSLRQEFDFEGTPIKWVIKKSQKKKV